jgi:ACS family hexuronate transporter-like MFS transporter
VLAIVAALTVSVSHIDRQTMGVLAPQVTEALGIGNSEYGWLVGAFSIAYLVFTPLSGTLADRFGARWSMTLALFAWTIVAGAHALASSFAMMFVLRLLLGTTEAPTFPAAAQAVHRALPNASRPLGIGLLFTGGSLGSIVAAEVAPMLDRSFGLRGAFLGTAIIGFVWLPAWFLATRGHGLESGAGPATISNPEQTDAWSVSGVVLSGGVVRAVLLVFGSAPILMFMHSWTAKYLVEVRGVPRDHVGHLLIVPPLAFDAGAIGFGWAQGRREATWTHTHGVNRPTHTGLLVVATLLTTSMALTPLARSPVTAVAMIATASCGVSAIYGLVTTDMLARVPSNRASLAGGMTAAAQSLSHVIAGPLVGWTVDRTHGYGVALVGLGVFAVPMSIAFLLWPVRTSR